MRAYVDTSVLGALFLPEAESARAAALVQRMQEPLAFTPLHRLELRNAIRLAVLRRRITALQATATLHQQESHERAGFFMSATPMWNDVYAQAELLSADNSAELGCRALDILHVAAALTFGVREFYTFDQDQARLARAAGLKVLPAA
jgi:predicted nucleic acid-binding protein